MQSFDNTLNTEWSWDGFCSATLQKPNITPEKHLLLLLYGQSSSSLHINEKWALRAGISTWVSLNSLGKQLISEYAVFCLCSQKGLSSKGWRNPSAIQRQKHKLRHNTSAAISAPKSMLTAAFLMQSSPKKAHSSLHTQPVPLPATRGCSPIQGFTLSKTRSREVPALTHSPWGQAGGQAPAWHCHTTAAHTTASPISCPWLCSSHQLGVEKTEGRDLPPHSRLKKKQCLQSIARTKILILFFPSLPPPPPPPADFRLTMSTKLQVKNCRLYFSKPLILILLLQSFDCLKRIKE